VIKALTILLVVCFATASFAATGAPKKKASYIPPRPALAGIHVGMTLDSVDIIMKQIAKRRTTNKLDSLTLIESDSIRVFGEPAYIRVELLRAKVRTIVVNYHPLNGGAFFEVRKTLLEYFERFFGRGVPSQDLSVSHRRWETEDGTHEVSYTDKYTRIFVRLGKREH
jgi:hypothetical protein